MTLTRIVAIPLIVGLFYLPIDAEQRNLWATVMFVVFALTDWLDGYLARKLNRDAYAGEAEFNNNRTNTQTALAPLESLEILRVSGSGS